MQNARIPMMTIHVVFKTGLCSLCRIAARWTYLLVGGGAPMCLQSCGLQSGKQEQRGQKLSCWQVILKIWCIKPIFKYSRNLLLVKSALKQLNTSKVIRHYSGCAVITWDLHCFGILSGSVSPDRTWCMTPWNWYSTFRLFSSPTQGS